METENKNSKGLIILVVFLLIIILGLIGFIVYDKVISNNDKNNSNNTKEVSYKSYNTGDKVTVKLNDSEEATFYVLKQSSEKEETVNLIAEKNIGYTQFNNDYSEGNEFKGSLIESKLNELTASWKNVKEKRLITVDEIKATGLTKEVTEDRCIDGGCPEKYTYINPDTFLLYPGETYDINHYFEMFWTMTKVDSSDSHTGNTNHYVYLVDMTGALEIHIVGYEPGGEYDPSGSGAEAFGIKPVIVVSKDYIK